MDGWMMDGVIFFSSLIFLLGSFRHQLNLHFGVTKWKQWEVSDTVSKTGTFHADDVMSCDWFSPTPTHPLVFGRDDELLVLLGHHAAGAVGGLQHVDDQVVGQHVQLLHVVPGHIDRARHALPAHTGQSVDSVSHTHMLANLPVKQNASRNSVIISFLLWLQTMSTCVSLCNFCQS